MLSELRKKARDFAEHETATYGLPTMAHFQLSLEKAEELAEALGANKDIAYIGACLMDIKLGQAFSEKRLPEHVTMGTETAKEFLAQFSLEKSKRDLIINCISAHHGTVPYMDIESEVVANADCYRFIHPKGVLDYLNSLAKRDLSPIERIEMAESKLEEKHGILSLDIAKQELEQFYSEFKKIFAAAKN